MRVLICDDEPLIAASIAEHLEQCGFTTAVFHEARELLRALDGGLSEVGLIITDLVMPDIDGLRLADTVRKSHGTPVLLISSHRLPFSDHDLTARGLIGIMRKPLHLMDIERIAQGILEQSPK